MTSLFCVMYVLAKTPDNFLSFQKPFTQIYYMSQYKTKSFMFYADFKSSFRNLLLLSVLALIKVCDCKEIWEAIVNALSKAHL